MTFQEKLKRAASGVNKSSASKGQNLKANTISTYIAKGSLPRADIALKIARALKVPLDWLVDPDAEWPPPQPNERALKDQLPDVPHGDFVRELARRYRLGIIESVTAAEQIEAIDWTKALAATERAKIGETPPEELVRHASIVQAALDSVWTAELRYNPAIASDFLHDQLPGKEFPIAAFQHGAAILRYSEAEKRPGFREFLEWMNRNPLLLRSMNIQPPRGIGQLLQVLSERQRAELLSAQPPVERPAKPPRRPRS